MAHTNIKQTFSLRDYSPLDTAVNEILHLFASFSNTLRPGLADKAPGSGKTAYFTAPASPQVALD